MGSQYKYSCSNFNDLRRSIGRMNGGGGGRGRRCLCRDLVICHRRAAVSEVKQQLQCRAAALKSSLGHNLRMSY